VHEDLTVEENLVYSALLRLPGIDAGRHTARAVLPELCTHFVRPVLVELCHTVPELCCQSCVRAVSELC
jgi:hypothetical protein